MSIEPECRARWITRDLPGLTFQSEVMPAPCLRREFDCPAVFRKALVRIAAPGYCDLRLDGGRIDRSELAPTVSVFFIYRVIFSPRFNFTTGFRLFQLKNIQ